MNRLLPLLPFALSLTLAGCSKTDESAAPPKAEAGFSLSDQMLRELKIDTVRQEPVRDELTLSGQIASDGDQTVKVYPLVGGVVEQLSVELGDHVTKGQVLAVIRSGEIADLQNQSSSRRHRPRHCPQKPGGARRPVQSRAWPRSAT